MIFSLAFYFLCTLICIHYIFLGPIILILAIFFKQKHKSKEITPSVSLIIAAYNEEKIIREKIENNLNIDYPKDKLEIIIVSDGSTDDTPKIVSDYQNWGVILLHREKRQGKTAALNRAVLKAKNDIVIFSDANSMFRRDAVKKLVRHFFDPKIGGVSGRKSILSSTKRKASLGDKFFWKYESTLKNAESNLGSIPTADGEIFALRRNLFQEIDPHIINDDMAITLSLVSQGKRVIYDQEAVTEEEASLTLQDDFNVKARMVYGGVQILSIYSRILNPFNSFFSLQFFFHKTLRYFMWVLLVLVFILNIICLQKNIVLQLFFYLQCLFYISAIVGYLLDKFKIQFAPFYFPYYYCNVNIAAFKGFLFFLKQQSLVNVWIKAAR